MKKKHKLSIILSLFVLCNTFMLHAQQIYDLFPDSYTVREKIVNTWFSEPISIIRDKSAEILQTNLGDYFLVRAEEREGLMEIIVSPLVVQKFDVYEYEDLLETEDSVLNQSQKRVETWPKEALGSWILYRDVITGKPVKIRHYVMPDTEIFVEFFTGSQKTKANFSIYGGLVANQVPVSVDFDFFYTSSIKDIITVTNQIPWHYAAAYSNIYSDTMNMITKIRDCLPQIEQDLDSSVNSEFSFLKWIIDGLVEPQVGGILFDEPLFNKTISTDDSYPMRSDAYKGFDYVRNLATACLAADTGMNYTSENSSVDVTVEPFAYFVDNDGVKKRVQYLENNGYNIELLQSILYVLATTEPQLFYLGAIRESEIIKIEDKRVEQFSYNHVAAFFPWFDEKGLFCITVFQDGKEIDFDDFVLEHPDSFVHLVRVKSTMNFYPRLSEND